MDRGFSNSERIVSKNPIEGCNEVFAPINNQQKEKIPSRIFSRKVRENEGYEKYSPTERNSKRLNFNCRFPPPNCPVGNEGFSDGFKQGNFGGYEIEYEAIDCASGPPIEMISIPKSPMASLPWYATNGRMFDSTRAPIKERNTGLEGPLEDYMEMEVEKLYEEIADEAPLPPIRKTISYATVHSHTLSILRKEYQNKIPKAPMRVDSKRKVHKNSNAEEKLKKSNGYDLVSNVNPSRNQLTKAGSGYLPGLVTKAINNRPNELSGKELNEVQSRRKKTIKIQNTREEEPEQTTHSNDNNQQVFYQLSDVLTSDRSKKTAASQSEAKGPIEETTEKVLNNSNPKPINCGNRNLTLPLAKVNPKPAARGMLHKSKSPDSTPSSNNDQHTEEQYIPQKLINNRIAREKREISATSVIKKEPPPVPTKRTSFCKDTSNNDTSMEDKSVMEEKKGIKNLVQDLENKLGLNQKSMLDNFSSKSYFPKQLNDYQDPPMQLKHVESTK